MPSVTPNGSTVLKRRVPTQSRSRERVAQILDAGARLVVGHGVDAVTTRALSEEAGIPVASIYQYFADRDAVLLALVERDMAEMDEQVATDLGVLANPTLAEAVETVMRAFVKVYRRRPAFVEIWMRGRTNAAIHAYGREHNRRIAEAVRAFGIERGLVPADFPEPVALLAVEAGDRVFQLAFEHSRPGDRFLIDEGIALVTAYLQERAR